MVGQTVGEFGDDVRCRRRDQQQVRAVGELDVPGPPAFLLVKEAGCHRIFRKRLQCERRNKFSRIECHDDKNFVALFKQQTGELSRLVAAIDPVTPSTIDLGQANAENLRPLGLSRFLLESLPSAIISRSNAGSNNFLPP